ncbi:TonB-dependent receptor domain-containing protein [Formosa haliotis]|uniref:TonB-dependent receptor domain-containing protein n=1 Tax=Formosa haliotis TaxID=1555194 RepID=UPI00082612D4|nr:TonB-dependent receptor [Formosa haliotis]
MKYLLVQLLAIITIIASITPIYAQNISGQVRNSKDVPVANVTILFNNNIIGETNAEGRFSLTDSYELPITLQFKHPEYYLKSVTINRNNSAIYLSSLDHSEDLDAVVLSSTYQKESQVLIPTSKITTTKFAAYSPIDLVSAINETPGVYIQSGALNTNRIIIRGVGSRTLYGTNKIRAYFNDIPITNGTGATDIDAYNAEDISNIEIVKGPKATPYGTNLGGTLLLNSKEASAGETYFKDNVTVGSFGLFKNTLSLATAQDKFAINLNYDHMQSDGFRDNSAYNRHSVLLTSKYKFNPKNEIGVLLNYTDYHAQIASSIGETAFQEDPTQAAYTWGAAQGYEANKQVLAGIHFTHRFSETFSNTSSVFYNYLDHYEPRPFNILDEFTNGYGARTLFAKDFKFLKSNANLSFGTELYKDEYNWKTLENLYEANDGNGSLAGDLISDNVEHRNNLNVFATMTLPITEKLKAQLGFNVNATKYRFYDEFNTGEANKDADRDFDPIFAPNLNVIYQFTAQTSMYANISRGFNFPSMEETLTPEGLINPDLGPETGFNYEIGSEVYLFESALHMKIAAYIMDINNLLVADRVGEDQYIGRNAGKTEHKGIELSVKYNYHFTNGLYISPYLNAEFSDHRFIDFVDGANDYSGNDLTGVPDIKINGGLVLAYKNLQLSTNVLHVGEMPLDDGNTLSSNPYTVLNAKLDYSKQINKHLFIGLNVGVNNFTDEAYASAVLINAVGFGTSEPRYYYPGMPINWYGGLKIGYSI